MVPFRSLRLAMKYIDSRYQDKTLVQPEKRASRLSVMGYVETWCQEGFPLGGLRSAFCADEVVGNQKLNLSIQPHTGPSAFS